MPTRVDPDDDASPPPQAGEGGWLAAAEEAPLSAASPSSHGSGPLRRAVGRLAASWRYLADPAERHALIQQARGSLSHMIQSLRHPPMSAVMEIPPALPAPVIEDLEEETPFDSEAALARLDAALRQLPEKGEVVIPSNLRSLDRLLSDTLPSQDFEAADLLHDCFLRGTRHSGNRVLLAVARNLTRNFGRQGRLPMASGKAWTMLNPALFADQMAAQLAEISDFVLGWQAQEKTFLILEFAEVELIEYLFEHLHPRRHGILLIQVMEFKVLSTRRAGLLRRIPARVRRFVQHTAGADPAVPLTYAKETATLLELIEKRVSFRPVTEAAAAVRAEVEKIIDQLAPNDASLPPGASGGGLPLGSIRQPLAPSAPPPAAPQAPPPSQAPERPLPTPISAIPGPPIPSQTLSVSAPPRPGGLPVPVAKPRKRFANQEKASAVMQVLAGESPEAVANAIGAKPETVIRWRNAFLNGGAAALAVKGETHPERPAHRRAKRSAEVDTASIDDLRSQLNSLLHTVEILSSQLQALPQQSPPPPALPAPKPQTAAEPPTDIGAPVESGMLPDGFPAEDPNPPPRAKRSRTVRRNS